MIARRDPSAASFIVAAFVAGAFAHAAPARAQVTELPPDVQQKLDMLGAMWNQQSVGPSIRATVDVFAPLLEAAPKDGITPIRDVTYGPHPRHKLDVYQPVPKGAPDAARAPVPVVIFVHGGSYVSGDKNAFATMYANVAIWFARQGVLALNATYRLAPQFAWPAAAQDVGAMVVWARANVARYGGDPTNIYLMGHSAGATHVATYVFDKRLQPASGPGIAGAVLISGRYRLVDVDKDPNSKNIQAYFGSDPVQFAARSALTHIRDSKVPVFIAIAEHENPTLDLRGAELFAALCARDGACPPFMRLARHNHMSAIAAFNTPDEQLGKAILGFMGRDRAPAESVKR